MRLLCLVYHVVVLRPMEWTKVRPLCLEYRFFAEANGVDVAAVGMDAMSIGHGGEAAVFCVLCLLRLMEWMCQLWAWIP